MTKIYRHVYIYKKEYMATFMVVERYVYYLKHDHFIIKTNHESLKFMLEKNIPNTCPEERFN
jgi:hypothetical protein